MYKTDKGYVSNYKGIPIEIIPIRKDDVVLAHVNKDIDIITFRDLHEQLQRLFPDNRVNIINDYFIDKITIFTNTSFHIDCVENEFLGRPSHDCDLYGRFVP